jgi:hypothetical protein
MRRAIIISLFIATMPVGSGAKAQPTDEPCRAPFDKLLAAEVFNHYPATPLPGHFRPIPPMVKTGQAHTYRTVIRDEAKSGPNFAGHYTLARIGCGAATTCLAIVDAATGRVYFPPSLGSATALLMDTGQQPDLETLNYRLDSRLLVVAGEPNEDEKRAGMSYYLWDAGKLRLIRFVPGATLCRQH